MHQFLLILTSWIFCWAVVGFFLLHDSLDHQTVEDDSLKEFEEE